MTKKHNKKKTDTRAEPKKRSLVWACDSELFETLKCRSYTSLEQNPEISTAVDRIASLISSMTIHLMKNIENGDVRVKNELSRIVDIHPNDYMNRSNFIHWVVKTMLLSGTGNAVVYPETERGYLKQLIPISPATVAFIPAGRWGYKISIAGAEYDPKDLLHFAINPSEDCPWKGMGYRVALSDIAKNLKQAVETERAFMETKWKPSLIIKADGMVEEFSSKGGRKKLLEEYIETSSAGEPWIVPAEQFEVQTIKPLTLGDLALADFVQIDKKTAAAILGVPSFVVGVGEFKRDEWNNFISTKIMPVAQILEQELTRKLLYSEDWFFKFNSRSLYNYELKDMAEISQGEFVRGLMTGNEARDWLGLSPLEGLDELTILENYIPLDKIGDQGKLKGSEK